MNSELAVQVLQRIAQPSRGNYSTKIAEELHKPQSSISRIIKQMKEIGFVEKGTRKKAQYYEIDYCGITEYWLEVIRGELKESNNEKGLEVLDENERRARELNKRFTKIMLKKCEIRDKTLQTILFDDFLASLADKAVQNEEFFQENEFLLPIKEGLVKLLRVEGYPAEFEKALEEC